jgi:hypothetical protein
MVRLWGKINIKIIFKEVHQPKNLSFKLCLTNHCPLIFPALEISENFKLCQAIHFPLIFPALEISEQPNTITFLFPLRAITLHWAKSTLFAFLPSNFYQNMAGQCDARADHDVFCDFFKFDNPIQNRRGTGRETTGLKHNPCMH